jgi:hypothetical protein
VTTVYIVESRGYGQDSSGLGKGQFVDSVNIEMNIKTASNVRNFSTT